METGNGGTTCLAIVCADVSANTGMEGAAARLPVFKSFKSFKSSKKSGSDMHVVCPRRGTLCFQLH